jgi:hypothetical protein
MLDLAGGWEGGNKTWFKGLLSAVQKVLCHLLMARMNEQQNFETVFFSFFLGLFDYFCSCYNT